MQPPQNFSKIIGRKHYTTKNATLLAGDDYWDGHNFERSGTNTFLYKTRQGAFFVVTLTQWQGQSNDMRPVSQDEAIELYEGRLTEHRIDYHNAFPGITIEEA